MNIFKHFRISQKTCILYNFLKVLATTIAVLWISPTVRHLSEPQLWDVNGVERDEGMGHARCAKKGAELEKK